MKADESTIGISTENTGTVQMTTADFEPLSDGNNNPAAPIDPEKLDLTEQSVERLSRKPLQKYRFIRSIGRGGMKMVLQVKDLDATRDVAMAVLPDAAARPHQDIVRFIQEARITASLEHPNIVPVHDMGVDATGAPYYTMKLLRGRTLASLIEKLASGDPKVLAEYNTTRLLRIFLKICYGVAFAHSRGVIHLDLKPDNIQIGDFGEVLIMDWGLAKLLEKNPEKQTDEKNHTQPSGESISDTQDGIMKGTPGYMAPEQAAGKNSAKDTRTDIYSLGAILYALMTWHQPLEQKEMRERIQATLTGNIIPPRERAPEREIPVAIEAVIRKAMSLHPDDRYQSVKEIRNEVNAYIGGYATAAEKAGVVKKSLLFMKRHLILMGFLTVILFVLAVGITYMFQQHQRNFAGWRTILDENTCYTRDSMNQERRPLRRTKNKSIVLNRGEYLWIDRDLEENIRLNMTVFLSDPAQKITVFLKMPDQPVNSQEYPSHFLITLNDNGFDTVRNNYGTVICAEPQKLQTGENRISISLAGSQIAVAANDKTPYLSAADLLPPAIRQGNRIAVRSEHAPLEIRKLDLAVQTIPEQAPPRLRGDIFAEAGLYRRAVSQYLSVADLYPYDAFADEALADAGRIAAFQLNDRALWEDILEKINSRSAFSYGAKVREYEALYLWKEGLYEDAFRVLDLILAGDPKSNILESVLALPHRKLSPQTGKNLLERIAEYSPKRKWIDLSGYGLENFSPLRNMKLQWIDISGNLPASPDVLTKMQPRYLKTK